MSIPPDAVGNLTGRAGMGDRGLFFSGNIYNGNKDWTVTHVTIMLVPKRKGKDAAAFLNAKKYNEDVTVAPLTSAHFFFAAPGPKQEYSWNIVAARGHK